MLHIIKEHYPAKEFYRSPDGIVQSPPLLVSKVMDIINADLTIQRSEKHSNTLLNKKISKTTQKKEKEPSK